jgi:phospholipid/cholesterol/gamma-HCH transport system substrate-binding protein
MFDYTKSEIITGAFLCLGLAALGYLSISIGGLHLLRPDSRHVVARFSNVGDLKVRAPVKVAGVTVGRVDAIRLADYYGEAVLAIDRAIALPKDTIASIATAGLLGDAYVALSPGAAEDDLHEGDRIAHTEPALNVADLLGKYAFGGNSPGAGAAAPSPSSSSAAATSPTEAPIPSSKGAQP